MARILYINRMLCYPFLNSIPPPPSLRPLLTPPLPLYGVEVVDESHHGEPVETTSHYERRDGRANDCKDYDRAKVLEEITL
jgi:hypothetical protein